MTKPVIVTRIGKGSELTFQEGDDNFTNLRDATISVSADSGSTQNIELNGTIEIAGGTGISTAADNGVITVSGFDGDYDSLSNKPTLFDGEYSSLNGTPTLATVATSGSYTDLSEKPTIPTNNNELTNGAGYITGIDSSAVTTALGFTPENSANKNANNGYAGLDSNGKVAAAQLPSYVDDVIEAADFAALPEEGETGKIYVAIDTGKIYRWSGSAYVEISASPGSTDAVTEGTTNLYFTTQRARDSFSASTGITITNGAIATTITQYTDSDARGALSAGTGISYDSATGVITSTVSPGIASVSADTTPALGGNLNVAGNSIVSASNGNIVVAPNGTGKVVLSGIEYPNTNGTNGQVLTTNGSGVASWQDAAGGGGGGEIYSWISFVNPANVTAGLATTEVITNNTSFRRVRVNSKVLEVGGLNLTISDNNYRISGFEPGDYMIDYPPTNNSDTNNFPAEMFWWNVSTSTRIPAGSSNIINRLSTGASNMILTSAYLRFTVTSSSDLYEFRTAAAPNNRYPSWLKFIKLS